MSVEGLEGEVRLVPADDPTALEAALRVELAEPVNAARTARGRALVERRFEQRH